MLSTLIRPFKGAARNPDDGDLLERNSEPLLRRPASVRSYTQHRHATADFTEADDDDDESDDARQPRQNASNRGTEDEDGLNQAIGVLPLFCAGHLDSLPIYSMTHAIRIIVQARTDTTLTWEQLRSPQVFQFLVKPMQQQIRSQHFSRGTLYALMANCLQFEKESQVYPANTGTSSTRAKVCELLAIKLLKEYSTRELVDALSYDFYPLQGVTGLHMPTNSNKREKPAAMRTSTLEVAIRASAKHFLSHPLVVQQLEAIWNGAISFYSAADQLHRRTSIATDLSSAQSRRQSTVRTPLLGSQQGKEDRLRGQPLSLGRRSVTLYDPRQASVFKLSRLRVPRYRHFLSTCSLGVLLCLFMAVLNERSSTITTLELIFWFWSAGFMLDEIIGFNEHGFSLYIMSFWNIFDLGILLLLIIYYCMRIYGVFLLDPHKLNDNAYDVLAAIAILLLPRIFSILDHYQYFSQLLIAFRLMAVDLAAVFVLVIVVCCGFSVFFISKSTNDPSVVAYSMFQILVGYSPAAWEIWPDHNWMGKMLLGLFLIICHFVIVTLLVTVLTNSFMAIALNAKQEHQFLFAINTISMVKNDSLFSYVAPVNILAWALTPLRFLMPMRQFVWLNRTVIKATHFPLLLIIFIYERFILAPSMYEPTDLVENPGRSRHRAVSIVDPASRTALFSPSLRIREESLVGFQKDRALEEVFRRAPDSATIRTQRRNERRKTQNAIRTWMDQQDGTFTSPHDYGAVDNRPAQDWQRRMSMVREQPKRFSGHDPDTRSTASDPADMVSNATFPAVPEYLNNGTVRRDFANEAKENTDAENGDDELVTNDEYEEDNATHDTEQVRNYMDEGQSTETGEDYFTTWVPSRFHPGLTSAQRTSVSPRPGTWRRIPMHNRTMSNNTMIFAPAQDRPLESSSSASMDPSLPSQSRPHSTRHGIPEGSVTSPGAGLRSPRRSLYLASSRPQSMVMSPRAMVRIAPNNRSALALEIPDSASGTHDSPSSQRQSSVELPNSADLDPSALGAGSQAGNDVMSSTTTLAAAMLEKRSQQEQDSNRMNKLMLAKMNLQASLGEVVREMQVLRSTAPSTAGNSADEGTSSGSYLAKKAIKQQHQQQYSTPSRRGSGEERRSSRLSSSAGSAGSTNRDMANRGLRRSFRRLETATRIPTLSGHETTDRRGNSKEEHEEDDSDYSKSEVNNKIFEPRHNRRSKGKGRVAIGAAIAAAAASSNSDEREDDDRRRHQIGGGSSLDERHHRMDDLIRSGDFALKEGVN
ncbi:uncharacterized protein B0T23DRAFT_214339 [Neurospora hispaniola]|uniref:Ion transport domain-containing protein n=1 Tax=Neurospora hispaniola TaxID=588809 RepID=A0AAJ0MNH5_9PEZI|nr:hypothetical protein B0T23DRAFT_214339 [Neurospora hispaniola]